MKIAAVADIHAYGKKLDEMLRRLAIQLDFDNDVVVFLGDYIDGGTDSKYVVTRLMDLHKRYPHWQFLLGNHEDMMISGAEFGPSRCAGTPYDFTGHYYGWFNQGGKETLDSYKRDITFKDEVQRAIAGPRDVIPRDHLIWLMSRPTFYETENFYFVHAGVYPNRSLNDQDDVARLWIRDQFIDSQYDWGKKIIFGHTYHPEPVHHRNKIGIDMMHHGHGSLTAVIVDGSIGRDDAVLVEFVTV